MKIFKYTFIIFLLFVTTSCSKNNNDVAIDYGYEYFKIDSTKNYIYQVDSLAYNNNTKTIDTFSFLIKTKFTNSFTDTINNVIWRLKRFAKYKNTTDFIEIQNYFVQLNSKQLIHTENNIVLLKAVFPLKNSLVWNGNLFNSQIRVNSTVNFLNVAFSTNDTTFFNSTKITEEISKDFIFDIERFSLYQKNIGLVYLKNKNIETQTNQQGQPIQSGFDVKMRLIEITD